jgi:hypothetical protein
MLDIVTADQHESAATIDIRMIDYGKSWLAPARVRVAQSLAAKPLHHPQRQG